MKGLIKTEYHQTGLFISFQNQINTESTLRKLLCKPKDRVATEDKNNIVCETDLLKSRSDENKRSVRNCDCDKNEIPKHCWKADHNFSWDQKKVADRESRLIPKKLKKLYIL